MARTRTFLAIDVGGAIRSAATALQHSLSRCGADVNWVTTESMHVTLVFLGEVDERELLPVCRAVTKVAKSEPPFTLSVSGVSAFPTPRRPKILWAGITEGVPEIVRLHGKLEAAMLELGAYRKEDRAYTPHLTLGRAKTEADGELLVAEFPKYLSWQGGTTAVEEVLIMGSELRREGPEYTVIGRANLNGNL